MRLVKVLFKTTLFIIISLLVISLVILGISYDNLEKKNLSKYQKEDLIENIINNSDPKKDIYTYHIEKEYLESILNEVFYSIEEIKDIDDITFTGPYIEFNDDSKKSFVIKLGVTFKDFLNYKTVISVHVSNFNNTEENLVMKIDKVKIGKLSFKVDESRLNKIVKNKTNQTINELLLNQTDNIIQMENDFIIINKKILFEKVIKNEYLKMLFEIIKDNKIVSILYEENNFNIDFKAFKFLDINKHEYEYESIKNIDELLENKLKEEGIDFGVNKNGKVSFNSKEISQIIDYYMNTNDIKFNIYEDYYIEYDKSIYLAKENKLHLIFKIIKNNKVLLEFDLNTKLNIIKMNNDLKIENDILKLGQLEISENNIEKLEQVINLYDKLIFKNFFDFFENNNVNVTKIKLNGLGLEMEYEVKTTIDQIIDIIDKIENIPNNIKDKIEELKESVNSDNIEEVKEELINIIKNLIK